MRSPADRLRFFEQMESLPTQRDTVFHVPFHPLGWNRPNRILHVNLRPLSTPDFARSSGRQDKELERQFAEQFGRASVNRRIRCGHILGVKRAEVLDAPLQPT